MAFSIDGKTLEDRVHLTRLLVDQAYIDIVAIRRLLNTDLLKGGNLTIEEQAKMTLSGAILLLREVDNVLASSMELK